MKSVVQVSGWWAVLGISVLTINVGCSPDARFHSNAVYIAKQERDSKAEITPQRRQDVATALIGMFGTPDDPQVPSLGELDTNSVMDIQKLLVSAGPVASDATGRGLGLYREHCAHCHGVTGDGAGPTASFLNPYPRDYRLGVFKFKSTPKGMRPTHDDLRRVLFNGIAGTAMPSFKVLPENEVDALIHYVRYLSIRGEVERLLIGYVATELDPKEGLFTLENSPDVAAKKTEQINALKGFASEVVQKWVDAETQAVEIPAADAKRDMKQSIARGKELFYGAIANCVKCHGDSALGDGQTTDYDDWTKELEPANADALATFLDAGALPPRNIRPRNLRLGVYRGGRRPIDLYWRVRNGIDGTPMPAVPLAPAAKGLTSADIWCLIDYVRSLPRESVSKPTMPEQALGRTSL